MLAALICLVNKWRPPCRKGMFLRKLTSNSHKMRVVALVSGGKDSIFNVLHCIAAGHDVVAFANIMPKSSDVDELDSFMFQTVGHQAINFVAEAAAVALYRQTTSGRANCENLLYKPTEDDEVEDLFRLLSRVKEETGCQGVAVGAIASEYQRTRVENVCTRLGLTSFAYLWQKNQSELLHSMIKAGIHAVTIKVASAGLCANEHLGLSLEELEPIVHRLEKKFGVNVCGEGGEYETFVLDCPLFHKKIVLTETHVIKDSTGGYISIKSAKLEPKYGDASPEESYENRQQLSRLSVGSPKDEIVNCFDDIPVEGKIRSFVPIEWENVNCLEPENCDQKKSEHIHSKWVYLNFYAAKDVTSALTIAKGKLDDLGLSICDIAFVSLWLQNMDEFANVNSLYVKELPDVAPARACVATLLPPETPVAVEMIACKNNGLKRIVHVQSVSHWAPANIGPYSQSYKVGGMIFVAGQIPLVAGSMKLLNAPLANQLRLALRHVQKIIEASASDLTQVQHVTLFVAKPENVEPTTKMLRKILPTAMVSGLAVSALPRYADLEILAVASEDVPQKREQYETGCGHWQIEGEIFKSKTSTISQIFLTRKKPEFDSDSIQKIVAKLTDTKHWNLGIKIYFNANVKNLETAIKSAVGDKPVSVIPVVQCENPDQIITIVRFGDHTHYGLF